MRNGSDLQSAYLHRLGLDAEPLSVEPCSGCIVAKWNAFRTRPCGCTLARSGGSIPSIRWCGSRTKAEAATAITSTARLRSCCDRWGYVVVRHVGGVHGPGGPDAASAGNHVVLTVRELPSDENPLGIWYVDAGLGDALHEALPLAAGDYERFRHGGAVADTGQDEPALTERADWFGALADVFDLRFDGVPLDVLDHLWDGVLAAHRAWDAAGRP
jgi:hypothetical protein